MADDKSLYDRFNEVLETYAPDDLYRRALIIMITPVVLLQILLAGVLVSRYLDNVANVLARSLAQETALVVQLYEKSDKSDAALAQVQNYAQSILHMDFAVQKAPSLPAPKTAPVIPVFDRRITTFLGETLDKPFTVDSLAAGGKVEIRVQVEPERIFVFDVEANRAQAVGTPLLLLFMALSTLVFMAIAVVFMRNQIKPILDLTAAAQDFGKGRDTSSFKPEGATEVRVAGEAFIDMKRRIARHVDQRTTLLAGVSHDLRTILTRFKLELAVVRGAGGEQAIETSVPDVVRSVADSLDRARKHIEIEPLPELKIMLKANAFRRLLSNVIVNAMRFGKVVRISGQQSAQRLWLYVDDNGPGIPPHLREEAFRPFTRLDEARNLDNSGSGLGLAIALDIAQAQGGDITLEDSPLGGLRVAIKVPL